MQKAHPSGRRLGEGVYVQAADHIRALTPKLSDWIRHTYSREALTAAEMSEYVDLLTWRLYR